jgi:hypothetical protein
MSSGGQVRKDTVQNRREEQLSGWQVDPDELSAAGSDHAGRFGINMYLRELFTQRNWDGTRENRLPAHLRAALVKNFSDDKRM